MVFEQLLQHLSLVALLLLQIVQFLLNCLRHVLLGLLNRRQQILQGKQRERKAGSTFFIMTVWQMEAPTPDVRVSNIR